MDLSYLRRRNVRPVTLTLPLLAVLGLMSCNLAEGLNDVGGSLADPDAALLDHPGRKLASGAFHSLLIDGSIQDGGHVLALETTDQGKRLAIIPYLKDDPCFIEPAHTFSRLSSKVDVELPAVIVVQKTYDEATRKGQLSFVNFDCEEVLPRIEDASLPTLAFPANSPRGMLSRTASGELFLIEPGKSDVTLIAEGVTNAVSSGDTLWTIEDSRLVIRDSRAKVIDRTGDNVKAFFVTGGTGIPVAYLDEKGLWAWLGEDDIQKISDKTCDATSLGADTIAYFDECPAPKEPETGDSESSGDAPPAPDEVERRAKILTTGSRLGLEMDTVILEGPKGFVDLSSIIVSWGNGSRPSEAMFVMRGEPRKPRSLEGESPTHGDLKVASLDPSVDSNTDEGILRLDTTTVVKNVHLQAGQLYQNFKNSVGDLLEIERNDDGEITGTRTLARNVAQLPGGSPFSNKGVLADFDGVTGTLTVLQDVDDEIHQEVIAKDVPVQNQVTEAETGRSAFVANSKDGKIGTLFLSQDDGGLPLIDISGRVLKETTRFLEQPRALSFLRQSDTGYYSLRAYLIDAELELTVHNAVSEYRIVPWPAPGILYAVPTGDDQGLWYAKAR